MLATRHAAIVGSGPSGFYAADLLLQAVPDLQVDMYETLPTPFGLVRSGVAPDHPKLKEVTHVFDRIMRSERFRFIGNVHIGRDISVAQLRDHYHAVVLAYGASSDRKMGIPGEGLANCHSATEFVGWYNGHPDFSDRSFDLSVETAIVVGHGNVAADVARILLQPVDDLRSTDITTQALDALAESKVREVVIAGRRGPAQAKFTPKELRGLGNIPQCAAAAHDVTLNEACEVEIANRQNINAAKNVELFRGFENTQDEAERRIAFRFFLSPHEVQGDGRVKRMVFRRNRLEGAPFEQKAVADDEFVTIDCGLVFSSIGYRGTPLPGVAFDSQSGTVPNDCGRVRDLGTAAGGLYVTGWLKRGPSGIIGTNRADSIETVQGLLDDLPRLSNRFCDGAKRIAPILSNMGARPVSTAGWDLIDAAEKANGARLMKPREKFTRVHEMLDCTLGSPAALEVSSFK